MTFRVGQKVVCVNKRGSAYSLGKNRPANANIPNVGGIYTIRAISEHPLATLVKLREIWNDHLGFPIEPGFNASGFRPVVERETDISVFTEILRTTKAPAVLEPVGPDPRPAAELSPPGDK